MDKIMLKTNSEDYIENESKECNCDHEAEKKRDDLIERAIIIVLFVLSILSGLGLLVFLKIVGLI